MQIPTFALNEFLEIIHAYGAFLKEKEIVKNFNKDNLLSQPITEEIQKHSKDPYSYESREYGSSSGISSSEIKDFQSLVSNIFITEKEKLTKNLISSEKHYKKLKHKFLEHYPELKNNLRHSMIEHQKYMESKKRAQYQNHKAIISLSERFISFFHYQFGGGDGLHIAYRSFANAMNKKYNLIPNNLNILENKLDVYESIKPISILNIDEINIISNILKNFIEKLTESDLSEPIKYVNSINNGNMPIEDKVAIANDIITKNYNRFKNLHNEYTELKNF
jgi:hypothetical protein